MRKSETVTVIVETSMGVQLVTEYVLEHETECSGVAGLSFVRDGPTTPYQLKPICSRRCGPRVIGRIGRDRK